MPAGDAKRIRNHICELVGRARLRGETTIAIRVGDIRDDLTLRYDDAAIDIRQVLDTAIFKDEARVEFLQKTGPNSGVGTVYRFRIL